MYLAYALFCEGTSDFSYFEILVPRVIESTILTHGTRPVDVPERPSLRLGRRAPAGLGPTAANDTVRRARMLDQNAADGRVRPDQTEPTAGQTERRPHMPDIIRLRIPRH